MTNLPRAIRIVCVAAAWCVAGASAASAADAPQSIGRALAKLKNEKKLSIGYFGGSITAGAGASNAAKSSWRALTTAWFQERFPEASLTEINAAIGGTGSDLGAFRCQKDLISKDPDLVFVEFAVNDSGRAELRVKRSMEGIVRQIWLANPWAEIIFVYTTTKSQAPAYARNSVPTAVAYHQAIARHYGIPEINVGRTLAEQIARGDGTWETLTTDGVHPNNAGYDAYMKSIAAFLESHLNDSTPPPLILLPAALTKDPFGGAHLEDARPPRDSAWRKEDTTLAGQYPHYVASNEAGAELVHEFSGSAIGVYWLNAPDSGDIEWSIDDGPPQRLSSWDKYALKSARANYAILADDLRPGNHRLKIKVLSDKNPQSQGTWIRIGAFLVHCDC